jgi:hypothetical protein
MAFAGLTLSGAKSEFMLPEVSRMNKMFGFTTEPIRFVPIGVVAKSVSAA